MVPREDNSGLVLVLILGLDLSLGLGLGLGLCLGPRGVDFQLQAGPTAPNAGIRRQNRC